MILYTISPDLIKTRDEKIAEAEEAAKEAHKEAKKAIKEAREARKAVREAEEAKDFHEIIAEPSEENVAEKSS